MNKKHTVYTKKRKRKNKWRICLLAEKEGFKEDTGNISLVAQ